MSGSSNRIHFSSHRQDWATPHEVFQYLDQRYGPFELDAAASPENAKCEQYWTEADDALTKPWAGRVFANPPYKLAAEFVQHGIREVQAGRAEVVVFLVPNRPCSVWYREAYEHADEVLALSGRITFEGATAPASFPSCAIVLRRPATWGADNFALTYTMPKRHGARPRWYTIKETGR
jgi:site-specific DNA-methyltransferase (adenine-specific)